VQPQVSGRAGKKAATCPGRKPPQTSLEQEITVATNAAAANYSKTIEIFLIQNAAAFVPPGFFCLSLLGIPLVCTIVRES
jgi:hypothetical protein